MDDRELLERAAKAVGIKLCVWGSRGSENFAEIIGPTNVRRWNPLDDDADAFRLAVKLALLVDVIDDDTEHCTEVVWSGCYMTHGYRIRQNHDGDPYAATRRAIVRAAAEIGSRM